MRRRHASAACAIAASAPASAPASRAASAITRAPRIERAHARAKVVDARRAPRSGLRASTSATRSQAAAVSRASARSTIAASRGCIASSSMRRPSAVMRPSRSSAPSASSRSRPCASAPGGGAIEPAQRGRSPCGELERELRELDLRDFRRAIGVEAFALRPEAQADAGTETSRAAGALIGGRLRDRDGFEARETRIRIEARFAREAGVDDGAHAGQRQARFGDVRREHDAARAGLRGRERGVLLGERELAVQGDDFDCRAGRTADRVRERVGGLRWRERASVARACSISRLPGRNTSTSPSRFGERIGRRRGASSVGSSLPRAGGCAMRTG